MYPASKKNFNLVSVTGQGIRKKILSNIILRSINTSFMTIWQYQGEKQYDSFMCQLG